MARLGFTEWYPSEEIEGGGDGSPFSDPEVRARMAALIARAAETANASAQSQSDATGPTFASTRDQRRG